MNNSEIKYDFRGYDYDLGKQKKEIYQSLMDIESHLTRHFENEDFGNDSMNFVSVLISNNTKQRPVSIRKWVSCMTDSMQNNYCLGNEKIATLLDQMVCDSYNEIYATDDEIKDMLENYLYQTFYPYYSGKSAKVPTLSEFNEEFIAKNKELIMAATCNGILRNHMVKKRENLTKIFTAIEGITDQSEK